MANQRTYIPIATYTAPSSVSSYTFSSIPQTYTDLVLVSNVISTSGLIDVTMRYNGDGATTGLYSNTTFYSTGSVRASTGLTGGNQSYLTYYGQPDATYLYSSIAQFMNYSNTSTNKSIMVHSGSSVGGTDLIMNLYRSTSAISSIYLYPQSQQFAAGTTFTLYGIEAA